MSKIASLARLCRLDPALAASYVWHRVQPAGSQGVTTARINGRVAFEFDHALDPAIAGMRQGVYEVWTLRALRAFLAPGDTFVDAGANIGYLSAYAASLVGPGGQVHSFEPVPQYYARLKRVVELNPAYAVHVNNCALGDRDTTASIAVTSLRNIGWNTMVQGFMSDETAQVIPVHVRRLDAYLAENGVDRVAVIKIDVEGFELPVLRGLENYLRQTPPAERPVLLIEVAPKAYPLLHVSVRQLEELLAAYEYSIRLLDDPCRPASLTTLEETTNVLCLPANAPRREGH